MSDSGKNIMEIYDDIELCYKVMGLSFSDNPDRVDKVYKGLVSDYSIKLKSADQVERQDAQKNLEQIHDLYERITNSMIYKDYAREYEKYKQLKADEMQSRKQKQEQEKDTLMNCPYCNRRIPLKDKTCIYCHGKIYTPTELLLKKLARPKILIPVILGVIGIVALVIVMNSSVISR